MTTSPLPLEELRELSELLGRDSAGSVRRKLQYERIAHAEANRALIDECVRAHPTETFKADEKRRIAVHENAIALIDSALAAPDRFEEMRTAEADLYNRFPGAFGNTGRGSDWQREDEERDYWRRWMQGEGPRQIEIPIGQAIRQRELLRKGHDPDEARALLWDTGSIASGVPTHMAPRLYEYMEASIAMLRLPTTKLDTANGAPMIIPRLNAHAIGTQVIAQGTAIGGTDPTFTKTQLDAYKYGQLVQVASEVLQDTAFDVLDFLARDLGRSLWRVVDADLVVGTGTGEPLGVMTALAAAGAGSVTTGGSLITPTYESLIDLQYSVNDEYRSSSSAAWLMRDATAGVLRKLRDGNGGTIGAPLWQANTTGGISLARTPDTLLGAPAFTDPNVASLASNARIMAFGDWNAYYVRHVGGVVFERSDDYAFNQDLVTFRAKWRVDGDLVDLNAIKSMVQNV